MKHSVSLITYTPDPQKQVAAAAKHCYSKSSGAELIQSLSDDKVEEFYRNAV
jgi:thymidylate synthase (FAD)